MSRAGTPTDNPIIESLNGWMKAELILDFGISKVFNLKKTLDQYVLYFNSERFAAALDYTPPQSSTGLNWGSDVMTFYSCLLLLDRCNTKLDEHPFRILLY